MTKDEEELYNALLHREDITARYHHQMAEHHRKHARIHEEQQRKIRQWKKDALTRKAQAETPAITADILSALSAKPGQR